MALAKPVSVADRPTRTTDATDADCALAVRRVTLNYSGISSVKACRNPLAESGLRRLGFQKVQDFRDNRNYDLGGCDLTSAVDLQDISLGDISGDDESETGSKEVNTIFFCFVVFHNSFTHVRKSSVEQKSFSYLGKVDKMFTSSYLLFLRKKNVCCS